jgi:Domain of unknown function (DUF4411)
VPYCIDTSSLIAAWEERYPIEHFPNFWKLFEGAIHGGKVSSPAPVLDETSENRRSSTTGWQTGMVYSWTWTSLFSLK